MNLLMRLPRTKLAKYTKYDKNESHAPKFESMGWITEYQKKCSSSLSLKKGLITGVKFSAFSPKSISHIVVYLLLYVQGRRKVNGLIHRGSQLFIPNP